MEAQKFTPGDANQAMSLKTWWAMPFVQPLARKLVVFLVNQTQVSANQVTVTAIALRLVTALCFFKGGHFLLILGAISYWFAYVCDCTDGTVARLKQQSSELGRYLDHVADLVGDAIVLSALCWSSGLWGTYLWAGMLAMQVGECYVSYLAGFAITQNRETASEPKVFKVFNRYRLWWFRRNLKSFLSLPDYTAAVFVFFPLIGEPVMGLNIGFWMLFVVVAYSVLSTFSSIHSGIKEFP